MFAPLRSATRFVSRHVSPTIAVVAASALVACSESTATRTGGQSQLAFTTSSTTSSSASAALASVAPITKNGHTLDLTQVTIVVERAQLKRQDTNACAGDDDEHDARWSGHSESCASVKVGPTFVDLPLDTGIVTLPMDLIPAGTFREIEFRISLARIVGTFDGHAFDVTLTVNAKAEVEFQTPLVVTDSTPTSITVNVPIVEWLTNADGSLVDPRQILSSPIVASAVKARIAATLRAFEDEDHDGREDHNHGKGGRD